MHFWKLLLGYCVFMEVPHGNCCILEDSYGILCNFGSSSYDFWKFLMGFFASLEVPHGIV